MTFEEAKLLFLAELERQAPGSVESEDWATEDGARELVVDLPTGAWVYLTFSATDGYGLYSSEPTAGVSSEPRVLEDQTGFNDLPLLLAEALAYVEPFEGEEA